MKENLKIVGISIFIAIILFSIFIVITSHLPIEQRNDVGLEVGQTGTIEDWELTLTNLEYEPNSDENKINIVITVKVKYNGNEESNYSTNYLLWLKDYSKQPYMNVGGYDSNSVKYIFNSENREKTLNATFEIDKSIVDDPDMWFMIVLAKDVKYVFTK